MLKLETLLGSLEGRPDLQDLLRQFSPPKRFASKRFGDYHPRHPSQSAAADHLSGLADGLHESPGSARLWGLIPRRKRPSPGGVYLDGGFGVGKTHLLASLWNAAPGPKGYLSFDELMYFIGIAGPARAANAFADYRLLAVDEWELDDPGNLKMALAFLRKVLVDETFVAVTSNTLPLELGSGRFSQKDFKAEVEELASAFEVVRIEGEDYRHRHFEARPGVAYFADPAAFSAAVERAPERSLYASFQDFLEALSRLHPIRYRDLVRQVDCLLLSDVQKIEHLPEALRWVHFVDSAYDAGVRLIATGSVPLEEMFPAEAMNGPYAKKLSRCLSRLEEMLAESDAGPASTR